MKLRLSSVPIVKTGDEKRAIIENLFASEGNIHYTFSIINRQHGKVYFIYEFIFQMVYSWKPAKLWNFAKLKFCTNISCWDKIIALNKILVNVLKELSNVH